MSDYNQLKSDLERSWSIAKRWSMTLESCGSTATMGAILSVYDNDIERAFKTLNEHIQMCQVYDKYIIDPDYDRLKGWLQTLWSDLVYEWDQTQKQQEYFRQQKQEYEARKALESVQNAVREIYLRDVLISQWLSRKQSNGYIYLVKGLYENPTYKIGFSQTPKKRIRKFDVVLPFPIEVIHLITTDHMRAVEAYFHDKYDDKRVNGEWFELSEQDVADICAIETFNAEDIA